MINWKWVVGSGQWSVAIFEISLPGSDPNSGVESVERRCLHFGELSAGESPSTLLRVAPQTAVATEG